MSGIELGQAAASTAATHTRVTLPAPTIIDPKPDFTLLLSSEQQDWNGILVHHHRLAPQLEWAPAPQATAHIVNLVMRGAGAQQTRLDGRVTHLRPTPGLVSLLPSLAPASYQWDSWFEVAHFYLSPALVTAAVAEIARTDPDGVEFVPNPGFRDPLIMQLGQALLNELKEGGPLGRLYAESLTQTLVLHFLGHYSTLSTPRASPSHRLSTAQLNLVLDYIQDNVAADISLNDLAALAHLSPSYFVRQFKHAVGMPPFQYLIHCRVERAKELLTKEKQTLAHIAQTVGFADHAHLSRHFKRLTGRSPSDFRQESKNVQG
jgi:AraC family transcriptional regulator